MLTKYTHGRLTWIDIESPAQDEIVELMKTYKLHPLVGEELLNPTLRPKVEVYDDYIYLVLQIPVRTKIANKHSITAKEVDFVIGRDFIITTKYDAVEPLHNFSKIFETNSIVDKSDIGSHAGFIFYYMLKKLYRSILDDAEAIKAAALHTEKTTFENEEKRLVATLSSLSRELIDLKHILREHKEVLENFSLIATKFFGDDFKYHVGDIQAEYHKTREQAMGVRDLVAELKETNNALLSTKQNDTMKTFTIIAFITFPLSLIANIFSMNAVNTPIVGSSYDFEIIIAIMLVTSAAMFFYFRHRKWL